ncbi:MAG TPA: hypothetical protein VIT92_09135 [Burkholderiaceae bacterium]
MKPRMLLTVTRGVLFLLALAASAGAQAQCRPIAGLAQLLTPGKLVMLGEIHGTEQSPDVLLAVVCAARAAGLPLSAGLELPKAQASVLHAYLESDGGPEAKQAMLRSAFWQRPFQDGRSSAAMLRLLESLRSLAAVDKQLNVFALEEYTGPMDGSMPQSRDEFMAWRVRQELQRRPHALVITLTGNVHNMLQRPAYLASVPMTMGEFLADLKPVSVNLRTMGGNAWICAPNCGVHGNALTQAEPLPWIVRPSRVREPEYSASIEIGATSASVPAIQAQPD